MQGSPSYELIRTYVQSVTAELPNALLIKYGMCYQYQRHSYMIRFSSHTFVYLFIFILFLVRHQKLTVLFYRIQFVQQTN